MCTNIEGVEVRLFEKLPTPFDSHQVPGNSLAMQPAEAPKVLYNCLVPTFDLDPDLLARAGFTHMTRKQVEDCLRDLYQTLELRVGEQIARKLTPVQLSQFEKLIDDTSDEPAAKWLAKNCPDYREIVSAELKLIEDRLRAAAEARKTRIGD